MESTEVVSDQELDVFEQMENMKTSHLSIISSFFEENKEFADEFDYMSKFEDLRDQILNSYDDLYDKVSSKRSKKKLDTEIKTLRRVYDQSLFMHFESFHLDQKEKIDNIVSEYIEKSNCVCVSEVGVKKFVSKFKRQMKEEAVLTHFFQAYAAKKLKHKIYQLLNSYKTDDVHEEKIFSSCDKKSMLINDYIQCCEEPLKTLICKKPKFFSQDILEPFSKSIGKHYRILAYSQCPRTTDERYLLTCLLKAMKRWILLNTTWDPSISQKCNKIYKKFKERMKRDVSSEIFEDKRVKLEGKYYPAKLHSQESVYIIINFFMLISGIVNYSNEFVFNHHSPAHRFIFSNYLNAQYGEKHGGKVLRFLEHVLDSPVLTTKLKSMKAQDIAKINGMGLTYSDFVEEFINYRNGLADYALGTSPPFHYPLSRGYSYPKLEDLVDERVASLYDSDKKCSVAPELKLMSKTNQGRHVIIAISGYTSQGCDGKEEWKGLIEKYPDTPIYVFKWKSSTQLETYCAPVLKGVLDYNSASRILKSMATFAAFSSIVCIGLAAGVGATSCVASAIKDFNSAVKEAKEYGRLLATMIAQQYPLQYQSITLVGFSLGTQVILSCLNELKLLNQNNIIYDVYLLGSASSVSRTLEIANDFSVVRGSIKNGYCTSDWILKGLFEFTQFRKSIGLQELLEIAHKEEESKKVKRLRDKFRIRCKNIRIKNYDLSEIATGHLSYCSNLERILDKMM